MANSGWLVLAAMAFNLTQALGIAGARRSLTEPGPPTLCPRGANRDVQVT